MKFAYSWMKIFPGFAVCDFVELSSGDDHRVKARCRSYPVMAAKDKNLLPKSQIENPKNLVSV
jgi:hypothetical protein